MKNQKIQDGFRYPEITEKDYVLGAERSAPFEAINESGHWVKDLPEPEIQRRNYESYGCTNWATLEQLEALIHYLFLTYENFSERFQAIMSGQQENGNDPQKVYEGIRLHGVLPDVRLPFTDDIRSWAQYFSPFPMTKEFLDEANKFIQEYEFKHEYIFHQNANLSPTEKQQLLLKALKRSPVGISVYAWAQDNSGMYVRPPGEKDVHWTLLVGAVEGQYWIVRDSYEPFMKKLKWDFLPDVAKGIYLRKKTPGEIAAEQNKKSIMQKIIDLAKRVIEFLMLRISKIEDKLPPPIVLELGPIPAPEVIKDATYYRSYAQKAGKLAGLDDRMTARLIQTIQCESAFNPAAINVNANGTKDLGICQYNTKWYIGAGKPIPSEKVALENPEFCIDVMAEMFKAGRARDWICYRNLFKGRKLSTKNMANRKFGAFSSVDDPAKLSRTVKGILISILPLLIIVFKIDESVANAAVEAIVKIIEYGAFILSGLMTLYGLYRKWRASHQ